VLSTCAAALTLDSLKPPHTPTRLTERSASILDAARQRAPLAARLARQLLQRAHERVAGAGGSRLQLARELLRACCQLLAGRVGRSLLCVRAQGQAAPWAGQRGRDGACQLITQPMSHTHT
jgi:hypothetical protein